MKNLRSAMEVTGYTVHATDGDIGKVHELYFDDADWRVRYFVVDTGRWWPGRRILLPPAFVGDIQWDQRRIFVAFTREQVKGSPGVDTDRPVALQRKAERKSRRNWVLYLGAEALTSVPEALLTPAFEPINKDGKPFDPHLRTTRVVTGLAVRARDGWVGRIADLIFDDGSWEIRYLVVELEDGARVVIPPRRVKAIILDEKVVATDLPLDAINSAPTIDPSTMFTRQYEDAVLRHYQREGQAQACV